MKLKSITEKEGYGVGFFDGIERELPEDVLIAAVREIALGEVVTEESTEAEIKTLLVSEGIKQMTYDEFQQVAPYLFSYPTKQLEGYVQVEQLELAQDDFEAFKEKLWQLLKN